MPCNMSTDSRLSKHRGLIYRHTTKWHIVSHVIRRPINWFATARTSNENRLFGEHGLLRLGRGFPSPHIWLPGSATGRRHDIKRYPIGVPCSLDYGTVSLDVTHDWQIFSLTVYPRIVHVIKSFNRRLQSNIPRTLYGVEIRFLLPAGMLHDMSGTDETSLSGFRIEATVKARTLQEATARIDRTGFLDPSYWFGDGPGPHARKTIARWLLVLPLIHTHTLCTHIAVALRRSRRLRRLV